MTRPAAAARPRPRKRPPARPTAHVAYQPAGHDLYGRRARECYHAITDQNIKVGFVTRTAGLPLCGSAGPWADIPDGLFAPLVTCRSCQHIAATEHITITGGDA